MDDLYVTGEQIRAGRAIARMDQAELARRSGLSLETVKRVERTRGPIDAHVRTLLALHAAFREVGVTLVCQPDGGIGVRLADPEPALAGAALPPAHRFHP